MTGKEEIEKEREREHAGREKGGRNVVRDSEQKRRDVVESRRKRRRRKQ